MAGNKDAERVLVIVESPAKAKTINGYLDRVAPDGRKYDVEASVGHIRDLAAKASELPEDVRKMPWAKYAVNVDDAYQPYYVVHADKKQRIAELKRKLKTPTSYYLPPMRTARAKPSPGTCWKCSSPRCRCVGWSFTRSPKALSLRP